VEKKSALAQSTLHVLPAPVKALAAKVLQLGYCAVKVKSAVDATTQRPDILRDALNRTKSVMIPTVLMKDIFVENGINPQLIEHVPFGLDTASLIAHQTKTRSQHVTFGFIGTIFEHKGLDLLVEAFQNLPPDSPARLKIYGDLKQFPEYGKRIEDMVVCAGRASAEIEFCGTFPNSQLGSVLQNLDVLVVPSRWYENTPLVIQSAFATKTPVVATNLGGMSELIKHEQNGLLFELNDANSLKVQLERLITDRQLLEKITANIGAERTIEEMVDDIENVYEKVLRSQHSDKHSPTTEAHPVSGIIST
jgi:glycosyltransferase involved in cell wall biosynthesis